MLFLLVFYTIYVVKSTTTYMLYDIIYLIHKKIKCFVT